MCTTELGFHLGGGGGGGGVNVYGEKEKVVFPAHPCLTNSNTDDASNRILECDKNGGNIQVHEVKIVKGRGVAVVGDEVMVCQADNKGIIMVYDKALHYVRSIKHEGSGYFHDISADSHHNLYAANRSNSYI